MSTPPLPAPGSLPALPTLPEASAAPAAAGGAAPPSAAGAAPTAPTAPTFPTQAALGATGVSAPAAVAQIVAAMQAALADQVHVSSDGQQALRMEAFQAMVRQLAQHIQSASTQLPSLWPVNEPSPALKALATLLLQQLTAGLPQPQQLLVLQSWPPALAQAVLQQAGNTAAPGNGMPAAPATPSAPPSGTPSAPATAAASPSASTLPSPTSAAAATAETATPASSAPAAKAPATGVPLPPLTTLMQRSGVIDAQDGPVRFTLTLRVPTPWVQAQPALMQQLEQAGSDLRPGPLPEGVPPGLSGSAPQPARPGQSPMLAGGMSAARHLPDSELRVPFQGTAAQLQSGTLALVMQAQGQAGKAAEALLRTSALMALELHDQRPMPAAAATAPLALLPSHLFSAEAVQMLLTQHRTDPWLHMAALQASGQEPREPRREPRSGLCTVEGCQYMGRAACEQPFCTEMNIMWATDRAHRAARMGG